MLKAIALDDEPPALKVIEHFCKQSDGIALQKTFLRTDEALLYLEKFPVDLLFLDINMPAMSGIEFFKAIPQHAMVIFTTAYAEYAVEGFNLNAVDYLLKPFSLERFNQAVAKAIELYKARQQSAQQVDFMLIRADYSLHKVAFADILWVEGLDDYLKIHLRDTRPLVARLTMKALVEQLPEKDFIRVHRSFIVPWSRIEAVRNKVIYLENQEIPIGNSYEAAFLKRFGNKP
ncbi:MAG: LytTR family DNA-binding domain-containing protein [Spirosomataceae bacterium]